MPSLATCAREDWHSVLGDSHLVDSWAPQTFDGSSVHHNFPDGICNLGVYTILRRTYTCTFTYTQHTHTHIYIYVYYMYNVYIMYIYIYITINSRACDENPATLFAEESLAWYKCDIFVGADAHPWLETAFSGKKTSNTFREFIIYDNLQAFPAYIIYYAREYWADPQPQGPQGPQGRAPRAKDDHLPGVEKAALPFQLMCCPWIWSRPHLGGLGFLGFLFLWPTKISIFCIVESSEAHRFTRSFMLAGPFDMFDSTNAVLICTSTI